MNSQYNNSLTMLKEVVYNPPASEVEQKSYSLAEQVISFAALPYGDNDFILPNDIVKCYKGLIFDMDGTLIDTIPTHSRAWKKAGDHFGYHFNSEVMVQHTGASTEQIAAAVMQDAGMDLSRMDEVLTYKMTIGVDLAREEAGTLDAWKILEHFYTKIPCAMGTGSNRLFTNMFEEKFTLSKYFADRIVTAEEVAKHKPDPETFIKCAQMIDRQYTDCIVFEDGQYGIQAALSLGMDAFDVTTRKLYIAKKPAK